MRYGGAGGAGAGAGGADAGQGGRQRGAHPVVALPHPRPRHHAALNIPPPSSAPLGRPPSPTRNVATLPTRRLRSPAAVLSHSAPLPRHRGRQQRASRPLKPPRSVRCSIIRQEQLQRHCACPGCGDSVLGAAALPMRQRPGEVRQRAAPAVSPHFTLHGRRSDAVVHTSEAWLGRRDCRRRIDRAALRGFNARVRWAAAGGHRAAVP